MHNAHARNTVRYYILILLVLTFLFFSGDFGLLDVQKTALILAVGIDKEEDEFIITSQIALPQDSKQGKSTQTVQLVSRGKTVADAFEEINAKTGWYPKLVFCNLILLGESATKEDVFGALDYFIRDEYFSDNCQIAACDSSAKDILNVSALVDPSSSTAIGKVLSAHAERLGTVFPATLHDFAIGYYGDAQCSFAPIITTQPQQEPTKNSKTDPQPQPNSEQSGQDSQNQQGGTQEKPVFSARETALFLRGKRVVTLTADETFACNVVMTSLKLASLTVEKDDAACTLTIKQNDAKRSLRVSQDGKGSLSIRVTLTAGILDYSQPLPLDKIADAGDVPDGFFYAAEKKLSADIHSVFEKARTNNCDLFGVQNLLVKHKSRSLQKYQNTILQNTTADIHIRFRNLR